MNGYRHPQYAASLAEFGRPRELPQCRGWILEREIAGSGRRDGMGCYPLFVCHDWSLLRADVDALAGDLVSLVLVTDPFGDYTEQSLTASFDVVTRFKDHFIVNLVDNPETSVSRHHRYYARKALEHIRVEMCRTPQEHLREWVGFYQSLAMRHDLKGIKAFSEQAFAHQLSLPGMVMFRALCNERPVGAQLWLIHGKTAYNHLAAYSQEGYGMRASYGLYWESIRLLRDELPQGIGWLDLGAGAGTSQNADDGLTIFKRGWSGGVRPVYLCGRILDREAYEAIARDSGHAGSPYFPAYRCGEFA